MNKNKKFYLAKTKVQPNTFIGGVSATINTAALVASKLGISASRIKAFSVIGSNIQFAVTGGSYVMPSGAWNNSSVITYFKDLDGLVTTLNGNAFNNCANLAELNLPNCTVVNSNSVYNCPLLLTLNMPELTTCVCTENYTASFRYLPTTNLSFPKLISAGTAFCDAKFTTFSAPLMTTAAKYCFSGTINASSIYVPMLQTVGTAVDNIGTFGGVNTNCTVTVHLSMMTNNSGIPDGDLLACPALVVYDGYVSDGSYNTEFGGLAATVNTRKLIASKLGLKSAAIENVQVVGSDIRFKVLVGSYQLPAYAFSANTAITSFKDNSGKCTKFNYRALRAASNLAEIIAPSVTEIIDECIYGVKLTTLSLPALTTVSGSYNCIQSNFLTSVSFPSLTTVTITGSVVGSPVLNSVYIPALSVMNTNASGTFISGNNQCITGVAITIANAALTSNGGGIDADLQALISGKSAAVTYV